MLYSGWIGLELLLGSAVYVGSSVEYGVLVFVDGPLELLPPPEFELLPLLELPLFVELPPGFEFESPIPFSSKFVVLAESVGNGGLGSAGHKAKVRRAEMRSVQRHTRRTLSIGRPLASSSTSLSR